MRIVELTRGRAEDAEVLEATAAAHGDWVLAAAPLMTRLWLMRSAWAPGLRYVGGLAAAPDAPPSADQPPLSVGGAGLRLEDALAGCLAEAVERTAQIERDGDIVLTARPRDVPVPDQIAALIARLIARRPATADRPLGWVRARDATTGAEVLLPADWCLRRRKGDALALPGAALSTGCAAAKTADAALAQGLLELIERDAASLWWLGGRPAAALASGSREAAAAARLGAELRQGEDAGRTTRLLDISSDLPIPVIAAVAHHADGRGLVIGLAARLSPALATARAFIELCQMELGLALALGKQAQLGATALTDADRRHIARAATPITDLAPLTATDVARRHATPAAGTNAASHLAAVLARGGIGAWHVDLTRPSSSLPVIKAVAPQLQLMPGDLMTDRLAAVQNAHPDSLRPRVAIM